MLKTLAFTGGILALTSVASVAVAESALFVAYPPNNHETTARQIFLIGTAPQAGEVRVNQQVIRRNSFGHFAPSFPLKVGENTFTVQYGNQTLMLKVTRLSTEPILPTGLSFGKDSLTPAVNVSRLPGEAICLGAIAPAQAQVMVQLGRQTISLQPQASRVELPTNAAVLTATEQPVNVTQAGQYQGCLVPSAIGDLGQPQFQLTLKGASTRQVGLGRINVLSPAQLSVVEVTTESGVARTGPSTDYSRLTPLPKGTQASVTGEEGDWLRLDYGGWIKRQETRTLAATLPPRSLIRSIRGTASTGWTEIRFPLQVPVPVSVQQSDRSFILTLHNTTAQTDTIKLNDDPLISRLDWQQLAPTQVQYTFHLKSAQQWGYKLRYEGTSLVLSLRHPPTLSADRSQPLTGITILLDPGHGSQNDLGARGPTGYPEKDVTLVIAKLLREALIQQGAKVYLTREGDEDLLPGDRVALINTLEPTIALSLHYNALPDDGDALNTQGLAAFWYHPQAHSLAVFLHNDLVNRRQRPSYGVFWNNLALTRPTVAPAVMLELGFMIHPEEYEWIVNPQEQQALATAIATGIVEWLRSPTP